ncbi:hypothetical protein PPERSA_08166 [Pseudocohnilembus persalinus]|uniref:Calcineurin-like phosphoesterase domain-containing protein n=1 Tax=Pseudocohnilembus persalinus TaxID=266149 RepID=A0A0V0R374_PSEPJ|nr:hypothetical protein PPERSA_08166 [Pseudocohnilembus persalinus]|eukprot:KRX08963.1 hypothetical protein PPERSA_08166 [Pseudocohnilembus persalinus]
MIVAQQLNEQADSFKPEFIISVGDNFYDPDGVTGLDDPQWGDKWNKVYNNYENIKNLDWYGVLGNHDWNGPGLEYQFQYNKNGWKIEDYFWNHKKTFGNKEVAFVHIDTNYLEYGKQGQTQLMGERFKQLGWEKDKMILNLIEQQLQKVQTSDWIIVVGHHYTSYTCQIERNIDKIIDLFQKYKVDAYLSGHKHVLAFNYKNDIGYIMSGAGAINKSSKKCQDSNPIYLNGDVLGFYGIQISDNILDIYSYYTKVDKEKYSWKNKNIGQVKNRQKL